MDMNNCKTIIDNIYELEGLIREIEYRDEDAPSELLESAVRKAKRINEMITGAFCADKEPEAAPVTESVGNHTVSEEPVTPLTAPEDIPLTEQYVAPDPLFCNDTVPTPLTTPTEVAEPEPAAKTAKYGHDEPEPSKPAAGRAPLRTMFTINDLFKFKRELFGNSDSDMNEVFDMIASFSSYDEASEYFYGYLCWPKDNEQVAEFMEIIEKYFANVR